jgi:nucleotide-binding universal stress UspA family protein
LIRPGEAEPDLAAEPRLNPVLVSLDGTPLAERVLDHAAEMAALSPGAELVLMRAIADISPGGADPDTAEARREAHGLMSRLREMQAHLRREAEEYLEKAAAGLRARGVKVRTIVMVEDQPAEAILKEAKEWGAGLIALETRGRAGLSRFFLGSVADKVIRAATVPVLVHRHPG